MKYSSISCVQTAIPLHFCDVCNTQRGCFTSKFTKANWTEI